MRYFLSLTGSSGFGGLRATDDPREFALPVELIEDRPHERTFATGCWRLESDICGALSVCWRAVCPARRGARSAAAAQSNRRAAATEIVH